MKKTAKLLSLGVALLAGFGGTAEAADFKLGADVVSSYVWRGGELDSSPAIQPALSYTCPKTGVTLGAWGSYGVSENNDNNVLTSSDRYQETDVYITVPAGNFSVTLTDYYTVADDSRTFDFSKDSANVVELSVAYAKDNVSLLAAINIAGMDTNNAKYCEAGYKFYDKDGYTAKAVLGMGNENVYGDKENDKFALVNTGISVSKDRYTASCVYNPDTEKSSLVFMASF